MSPFSLLFFFSDALEQRECEVDVLSRLLNDCKNRLSNTNLDISDDI